MRRLALLAAFALSSPASAKDFAPRDDLEIVALDLATGAVKWVHKGAPLGHAHCELYPKLLAVYPHYDVPNMAATRVELRAVHRMRSGNSPKPLARFADAIRASVVSR